MVVDAEAVATAPGDGVVGPMVGSLVQVGCLVPRPFQAAGVDTLVVEDLHWHWLLGPGWLIVQPVPQVPPSERHLPHHHRVGLPRADGRSHSGIPDDLVAVEPVPEVVQPAQQVID